MLTLFQALLVALIAAMLAPYFSNFLASKKTKREIRLKYLEEAYELSKQLKIFSEQTPMTILLLISFQEYKIDKSTFQVVIG